MPRPSPVAVEWTVLRTPDEYSVIEAANPKLAGLDGAVESYVDFLYSLA